jgi:hypothetical protein
MQKTLSRMRVAAILLLSLPGGGALADTTVGIRQDPAHPLHLDQPPDSYAAGEKGRCVVRTHVSLTGDLTRSVVVSGTGFPRLDSFCAHVLDGQRVIPAMVNGVPVEKDQDFPLMFKGNPMAAPRSEEIQDPKAQIAGEQDGEKRTVYVVYSCVHFNKNMPAPSADSTSCSESKVFFQPGECKKEVPAKNGGETYSNQFSRVWIECRERQQGSWIPAHQNDGVIRLLKAEAKASDQKAMSALLFPLEPKARDMIHIDGPFRGSFVGRDSMSFFLVGDGSKVIVFGLSNLNDSQYANISASVSLLKGTEDNSDFEIAAEHAGVKLGFYTETAGPGAKARLTEQSQSIYQTMSITDFVVNGHNLATANAHVHLSGYYTLYGDVPVLFSDAQAANVTKYASGAVRQPSVPLLIDHASPELRRQMVDCDANPGVASCYKIDISGTATMCAVSNAFGATRSVPCIDAQHF